MEKTNVLWLDDQPTLFNQLNMQKYESAGICIVAIASNYKELVPLLEEYKGFYDAIILDVNVDYSKNHDVDGQNTSGFLSALTILSEKEYRHIPVLAYTAKPELLDSPQYRGNELLKRLSGKRGYDKKGGFQNMCSTLKAAVSNAKTPAFIYRNKFPKEFSVAQSVNMHKYLMEVLTYIDKPSQTDAAIKYMKELRDILEAILYRLRDKGLLPPIEKLNGLAYFLTKSKANNNPSTPTKVWQVKQGEELIPPSLGILAYPFVSITQDAKHNEESGRSILHSQKHLTESDASHFFLSTFYFTMDMLIWYHDLPQEKKWEEVPINSSNVAQ